MAKSPSEYLAEKRAKEEKEAEEQKTKWSAFTQLPGSGARPLQKYMEWHLEYAESGSPDKEDTWMLRKVWEEAHSPAGSRRDRYGSSLNFARERDFTTYFQKICFCKEMASEEEVPVNKWWSEHSWKFEEKFDEWRARKEGEIRDRFAKTHLPDDFFDTWRKQQDDSEWLPPRPFVALNEEQRKIYCTKVESGRLVRNGFPYDSSSDHSIFHKGRESAFSLSAPPPNAELYCGGHVVDVFHHSSFLGSGAVMCGGEIGTNEDGQVTFLSNKSGHYTPTEDQNIQMLEWFAGRGVDLDKVTFAYVKGGSSLTIEMNAGKYLREAKARAEIVMNKWLAFKKLPGTKGISLGQYKSWLGGPRPYLYQNNEEMWVLNQLWETSRFATNFPYTAALLPEGEDDFDSYAQKIRFCVEKAKDAHLGVGEWLNANLPTFRGQFERWNEEKAAESKDRFMRSHLPISYETWLEQQDDNEWRTPRTHVTLNTEARRPYGATVEAGRLVRGGYP